MWLARAQAEHIAQAGSADRFQEARIVQLVEANEQLVEKLLSWSI